MIPKIIHYCWFGKKEKPESVRFCINTWKKHLPDYQIIEWNENNFKYKHLKFTREAYAMKKYAFVCDVCRLYALYNYGGIYLDTDVEVVKSFNDFLNESSFVGKEAKDLVSTGVIGTHAKEEWVYQFLKLYENRSFITHDGGMNLQPNTELLTKLLKELPTKISPTIYPIDFFSAKDWETGLVEITNNTITIHHYNASWKKYRIPIDVFEKKVTTIFKIKNRHIFVRIYRLILNSFYNEKLLKDLETNKTYTY